MTYTVVLWDSRDAYSDEPTSAVCEDVNWEFALKYAREYFDRAQESSVLRIYECDKTDPTYCGSLVETWIKR